MPQSNNRVNYAIELIGKLKYDHEIRDAIVEKFNVARRTAKDDIYRARKIISASIKISDPKGQLQTLLKAIMEDENSKNNDKLKVAELLMKIHGLHNEWRQPSEQQKINIIDLDAEVDEPEGDGAE